LLKMPGIDHHGTRPAEYENLVRLMLISWFPRFENQKDRTEILAHDNKS